MSAAIVAAEHDDACGTQLPHLSKGELLVWHAPNSAKITLQSEYTIWPKSSDPPLFNTSAR